MNKGLEVIETARLFGLDADRIETVIHPQSIVHSLVEFNDGSMMAQLSHPDMRLPIQYALLWPERRPSPTRLLDLGEVARLDFHPTDAGTFPCLDLAYRALRVGGVAPCVLNAANQVAVESFLAGAVEFGKIPQVIAAVLAESARRREPANPGIARLLAAEDWAAAAARSLVRNRRE
jgi:1-deoxy-D-xylulose-5-phosphate reductoisomerase